MSHERMHILVSTGIFPNATDGNRGVYIFKQVRALAENHDVRVIAPVRWGPRWIKRYARFAEIPRHDHYGGLSVEYPRYVVSPGFARFLHGVFLYLSVLATHRRAIAARRPDVVLGYFAYPYGFAAVLAAATFRLPVVVSCRGSDINHLARPFLRRRLISWALRRCRSVLAVSADLATKIAALGVARERIRVVPNGIERDRFQRINRAEARERLGIAQDGHLAVCVSRLSWEKGIDLLLEAFAKVGDATARLVIVGDGAAETELRETCSGLGLDDRVTFAGARPHDEVPLWMSASNVSVLSSRTEGHPNVVLESLACGRPVVAFRVGGAPEILSSGDLGILVPPGDTAALGDGIHRALQRDWDEERLVAGASRTWADVAQDVAAALAGGAAGNKTETDRTPITAEEL